ncbi:late competence development ComFB family protein [Rhodoferax sp. 4810]|uniref:Late competence development ComFB family protein n=1 Tax=Thiospirillum jenense TaxID=1653858 RepID=A0A839HCY8_9GAMM|nr:late competence development ComFB family protein [Thiospirillum jenense]MBB1075437.1 late competence development ComFB family protein [Rhodoferax jenense]MBB1126815.1 late competence development ComFB family protein [Thiospirillum jenense]
MPANISNYHERLVLDRIREVLMVPDNTIVSLSQNVVEDLACIALNQLPPRYVRHAVDFVDHLTDAECDRLHQEVKDAVDFAIDTLRRRGQARADG